MRLTRSFEWHGRTLAWDPWSSHDAPVRLAASLYRWLTANP